MDNNDFQFNLQNSSRHLLDYQEQQQYDVPILSKYGKFQGHYHGPKLESQIQPFDLLNKMPLNFQQCPSSVEWRSIFISDDQVTESYFNFNMLKSENNYDAYEGALDFGGQSPSLEERVIKQNPSILLTSTASEEDNETDGRIQIINLQNIDILKEQCNLDKFYNFLSGVEFLNLYQISEDRMRIDQIINLVEIRLSLQEILIVFQKWTAITPLVCFQCRLQFIKLDLDQFSDILKSVIENGQQNQKHIDPRQGLINLSIQDQRKIKNQNQKHHNFRSHSLNLSVIFFKIKNMLMLYEEFNSIRRQSEKFKELQRCLKHLISFMRVTRILNCANIKWIKKMISTDRKQGLSKTLSLQSMQSIITQENKVNFYKEAKQYQIRGLSQLIIIFLLKGNYFGSQCMHMQKIDRGVVNLKKYIQNRCPTSSRFQIASMQRNFQHSYSLQMEF